MPDKFECTKKCYAKGRIWNPGDIAQEKVCDHFKPLGGDKDEAGQKSAEAKGARDTRDTRDKVDR